jgi:gamma-glutamylcyclotransferase (GGCT)/AIG2-like uncharacterized protein YtfP
MFYFAYGSNMNPRRMRARDIHFTNRRPGMLLNFELAFDKRVHIEKKDLIWGAANIHPTPGRQVEGALYEVEESELAKLDRFEGVPDHYTRRIVTVESENGKSVIAVTYFARPDKIESNLRPTREYLDHLLAGHDLLSREYRIFLKNHPTID